MTRPLVLVALVLVALVPACVAGTSERPVRGQGAEGGPPSSLPEIAPAAPAPGMIWVAGAWHYDGVQYVWVPGRWESPPMASSEP
jgi:hypothetical protein